jgi:PAS domain S-box-containing protein
MKNDKIHILLVDDDEDDFVLTRDMLNQVKNQQYAIDWVPGYDQAVEAIRTGGHDIYFVDYLLGEKTGIDLLNEARRQGVTRPVIMLTGKGDRSVDLEVMRLGAADYLAKDKIDSYLLERTIRYALERTQSLEALRESEMKYRNIFEKSRDVIYITNQEGNIVDINQSATKLFGYSREELLNMNARKLYVNENDRKRFEEAIARTGEIGNFEVTLVTKDGSRKDCMITATMQQGSGGEMYYQGIVHDLTQRKKSEREIRSIEKLAMIGRVARTIAHEVRNPLTNVNLSVEQLKTEVPSDDDTISMYFDIITRNCERINQLLTELLSSAKPAAITFSSYRVDKLLDETLELAADRIKLKEIKVETDYSGKVGEIPMDAAKMRIALLNIVINAVEAMKAGEGVLKISTDLKDDKCVVTISDNGAGINEENIGRLFEPFYSGKPKGMGLGLTTTQNIVYNHKGSIDVESKEGEGTTFCITLHTH